jgi:hypothetical protein
VREKSVNAPNGPLLYDSCDLLRQTLCDLFEDARHAHSMAYQTVRVLCAIVCMMTMSRARSGRPT